jgi:SAM-dependent methyltransferase
MKECLACGSINLEPSLNLGNQPLANEFLDANDAPQESYPLAVNLCCDCHHLQLTHAIEPDLMFKNYLYVSGTSETYRKYLAKFAETVWEKRSGDNVLDIGCNDGTQLDAFKVLGARTWGVDPAENLWPISTAKGHSVHLGYFDSNYETSVTFDIINAQNVFAHNSCPLDFLKNVKRILSPRGRVYIQTSQADMVRNGEFDTIYHEHINFFNPWSMKKLAERSGLVLLDVKKTPIHGVSFMFVLGVHGTPVRVEKEDKMLYDTWALKCRALANRIRRRTAGRRVVAYGAAAKGNTFLNYIGLKPEAIVDDNLLKQGKFSPGQRSPVVSKDYIKTLDRNEPIVFMPLAWNLFDEIKKQIIEIRGECGDEFIHIGHGPVHAWWAQPWECDFKTHPVISPLVGILIESRDHTNLEPALRNFSCMLPYASLCIIHSKQIKHRIETIIGNNTNVQLIELPDGPFGRWENNDMLQKPEFWRKFRNFHRVLLFGTDTGIKQNNVLRFMHFDYIGARWHHNPLDNPKIYQGNGGFSIRNPRLLEDLWTRFPGPMGKFPEDLWIAKTINIEYPNACMPLKWECDLFSTETRDIGGTFGFHDVDTYTPDAIEAYEVIDGPRRPNLLNIKRAFMDGVVNVTPLVKLGIGPHGLRIFKETRLGLGSFLEVDGLVVRVIDHLFERTIHRLDDLVRI